MATTILELDIYIYPPYRAWMTEVEPVHVHCILSEGPTLVHLDGATVFYPKPAGKRWHGLVTSIYSALTPLVGHLRLAEFKREMLEFRDDRAIRKGGDERTGNNPQSEQKAHMQSLRPIH